MRVSVVINTYNRGASLRNTLDALRFQTYRNFEVVVVNGPSTDGTDEVLAEYRGKVRVFRCPEPHLSKSRNIGIAQSAGDVVAFIDDDAIPEPNWLAGLVAAYDAPDVGGAGGLVYDHTGATFQYEYSACSRVAVPRFDISEPLDQYNRPGADPFLYLQGTNCSFRRQVLLDIGGFNEEIEYYLDETEVCMRTIDHGFSLKSLPGAAVHHKYLPSHIRDQKRVVLDPYSTVKNHCCFAVRNGTQTRPVSEVFEEITRYVNAVKAGGRANFEAGSMTEQQLSHFLRRTEQAMEFGIKQGLTKPRPVKHLPPVAPADFRPFETLAPAGGRLKVCFVSREYPPDRGGIGRFTADLARGYGAAGHEVHVVTHSAAGHTVDFELGVWVHRLPDVGPKGDAFKQLPLCHNYTHAANVYHEVRRIHAACGGLDLVSAPVWLCEGVVCSLDDRWPTVLTLHTTMKTIAAMGGTTGDPAHVRDLIRLEKATVQRAGAIYANSRASLQKARDEAGPHNALEVVVPHGTTDVRDLTPRRRPQDGKTRVLFVGRIEARKGVDVLLDAAYQVLPDFPDAELVLVGKYNPSGGETCLAKHEQVVAADVDLRNRIVFAGDTPDDKLMQAYADCDLFVLPSRYESFGLVLTEAMMFGKPVIAARAGGMAEIVEEGGNGLLHEPGDPASLAACLRTLLADAGKRAAFGARSRELYESKFSTEIMVTNTLAAHRQIAARFKADPRRAEESAVRERLKTLVADVSQTAGDVADAAVAELLSKRFRHAVDYPIELAKIWHLADEPFVRGLYSILLRRPADAGGLSGLLQHLSAGGSRRDVVEWVLFSEEARSRKTDATWFAEFLPPPQPPAALATAPPPAGVKARVKSRLKRVPGLGRGLKLLKHAVAMPRTVRRLEDQTAQLAAAVHTLAGQLNTDQHAALRALRDEQRKMAAEVRDLDNRSAARERQLQWVLIQQAERVDELLGQPAPQRRAA